MPTRNLHKRILIDGLSSRGALPDEYGEPRAGYDGIMDFHSLLGYLEEEYSAESRPAYFESGGKAHKANHWQAIVNPTWLPSAPGDPPAGKADAVWSVKTTEYTPVTPLGVWEPLFDAIVESESPTVFGEIRLSRDGGDQDIDLFFPDITVSHGDVEHIMGINTANDYFGNRRVHAEVVALDMQEDLPHDGGIHVMRDLVDPQRRKHVGDTREDAIPWWDEAISLASKVAQTLYGVVADAMEYEVDFSSLPCTIEEFYEHLGLPNSRGVSVAEKARKNAIMTCTGSYDAFHLHRAAMQALESEYDARNTGAFVNHLATVNTLLYNPPAAEKSVIASIQSELEEAQTKLLSSDEEAELEWEEIESMETTLAERVDSIDEGVEEYRTTRERLEAMLDDAEEDDEDEDESGEADTEAAIEEINEAGA